MTRTTKIALMLAILGTAAPAAAQRQMLEAVPPVATQLHPGLGDYHFPITTDVEEAQVYFDQGLALLYGFNHDEAARYFRRAAELDPRAAMPYWGLALAIGPNYNDTAVNEDRATATYDAVQAAVDRSGGASTLEQAYIDAIAQRYASPEPDADWQSFHVFYSEAMRRMVERFPDDLDAATMFAESLMMLRPWQLWTADGEPAEGTLELVAVLESVLRRNPEHPGANHFYIHAVEASPNLERAIPSAIRLMTLMPGAGHLVHMPGHIYLQTGDYDLAADTNVRAAAADAAFIERTGATGIYPLMYSTHNVHFIAYARAQQGRYGEARDAAEQMVARMGDADIEMEMQMLEGFRLYPLMVDLRFHAWEPILEAPVPSEQRAVETAFWLYARAMAYAGQGDTGRARTEQGRFEQMREDLDPELMYLLNNSAEDFFALAAATLTASISEAEGNLSAAIADWRRAVEAEEQIQYDEPPAWYYPVRQSLAAVLLRAGRAEEAEQVFRETLDQYPRDGRLLFGLRESLIMQRRAAEAELLGSQFESAWSGSTVELSLDAL